MNSHCCSPPISKLSGTKTSVSKTQPRPHFVKQ